jgi:hypothetical protein
MCMVRIINPICDGSLNELFASTNFPQWLENYFNARICLLGYLLILNVA